MRCGNVPPGHVVVRVGPKKDYSSSQNYFNYSRKYDAYLDLHLVRA